MFAKTSQFVKEVRIELGKVTWPTRKEVISSTIVVVVFSIIVSIFIGVVDLILSKLAGLILQ
ncbi:MAG: preprotein translocase subunit SecE [candidate division Zixibacteria bacterium]|nr:preprotein translocase subunit SecE [candidate division Zixibacteria bacterium]